MAWALERGELIEGTPLEGKYLPSSLIARKIMFGVPHKGHASFTFIGGLRTLSMPTDFVDCYSGDTPIDISRNVICTRCLQTNCDYLFFVDADIILRPDTLLKLLQDDFPIVSAVYRSRVEPYAIVARVGGQQLTSEMIERVEEQARQSQAGGYKKTVEVEEVGMGCILIHRLVLLRMAQGINEWRCLLDHGPDRGINVVKYTDYDARKNNWKCRYCDNILICNYFENRILTGSSADARSEDYVFCQRARATGFHVLIQLDNVVTHETAPWRVDEKGLINPGVDSAVKLNK
jgi:hypothetical protein